jgi:hypothetical protein
MLFNFIVLTAHNPRVAGSNPAPATIQLNKRKSLEKAAACGLFYFAEGSKLE